MREFLERGREVLFRPFYSPDFSLIGAALSELKALLRRARAPTTSEALVEAMGQALDEIVPGEGDAHGWFGHRGYAVAHSL